MTSHSLSFHYSDSDELIREGDRIFIDGHRASVELVCLPGTESAHAYSCEDTGGLLIMLEGGILCLEPIGVSAFVVKQVDGDSASANGFC